MVLVQVCGRESEPDAGAGTLPPAIQPKAMKKISPEEIAEERYPVNPDTMTTPSPPTPTLNPTNDDNERADT